MDYDSSDTDSDDVFVGPITKREIVTRLKYYNILSEEYLDPLGDLKKTDVVDEELVAFYWNIFTSRESMASADNPKRKSIHQDLEQRKSLYDAEISDISMRRDFNCSIDEQNEVSIITISDDSYTSDEMKNETLEEIQIKLEDITNDEITNVGKSNYLQNGEILIEEELNDLQNGEIPNEEEVLNDLQNGGIPNEEEVLYNLKNGGIPNEEEVLDDLQNGGIPNEEEVLYNLKNGGIPNEEEVLYNLQNGGIPNEEEVLNKLQNSGISNEEEVLYNLQNGGIPNEEEVLYNLQNDGIPNEEEVLNNLQNGGIPNEEEVLNNLQNGGIPNEEEVLYNLQNGGIPNEEEVLYNLQNGGIPNEEELNDDIENRLLNSLKIDEIPIVNVRNAKPIEMSILSDTFITKNSDWENDCLTSSFQEQDDSFNDTLEEMEMLMKFGENYMKPDQIYEKISKQQNNFDVNSPSSSKHSISSEPRTPLTKEATSLPKTPSVLRQDNSIETHFKMPTKAPRSSKKSPNYKSIVSPISLYIRNSPKVPLIKKVNTPTVHSATYREIEKKNSSEKLLEKAIPSGSVLPIRTYKLAAKNIFLSKENEPHLPNNIRKLIKGPLNPEVIKHVGRVKATSNLPASPSTKFSNNADLTILSSTSASEGIFNISTSSEGDVSLYVSKNAARTNFSTKK